jgi:septum formation protein
MSLWIAPRPLLLASQSLARRQLLAAAGIPHAVVAPDLDERAAELPLRQSGADAGQVARHLARMKAEKVSRSHPDDLVLAADQVLACEGRLFAKPADRAAAAAQLAALSGRTHQLHSAFCLMRRGEIRVETVVPAQLTMRPFGRAFIELYLAAAGEAVLDLVGAYQLEAIGIHLFAAVEGEHSTILGLPLLPLLAALRSEGVLA